MRSITVVLLGVLACGDDGGEPIETPDAAKSDAPKTDAPLIDSPPGACPVEKIKFTQATGCGNDGSVEFCIPDGNAALVAELEAIEPMISCAAGGGRAGCNDPTGLLLCFYPTRFPDQCTTDHGAMTDDVWADMCAIVAKPEITEIVHTIFE